jgi:type IV pilus assembly protein PilE
MLKRALGFTLMEILVALAIMAVLAAVIVPSLSQQIRSSNSTGLSQNLQSINNALQKYREDVGYYTQDLTLLTTKPSAPASTDACGTTLSSSDVALWDGPYLTLAISSNGIQSGDAVISTTLTRSPANTSNSTVLEGTLTVLADGVTSKVADDVEAQFDASSTNSITTGTVRYSSTTSQLTFVIPITGC